MSSKSFISKSCIILLLIAVFLIVNISAQTHVHEDGTVHDPANDHVHEEHAHDEHTHDEHTHKEHAADDATVAGNAEASLDQAHVDEHAGHAHEMACELEPMTDYNMSLRVGSLFIILGTSAVGIFSPMILYRIKPYREGSIRDWVLTAGKFFGTGVILATAFIHMLPEALERFGSECLGEGWHSYHAFGGLFCMLASFFLQIIELAALSNLDAIAKKNAHATAAAAALGASGASSVDKNGISEKNQTIPAQTSITHYEHDHTGINEDGHVHSAGFLEHEQSIRNIGTFILELGIVMHSIIIGITLGTVDNAAFQTLLIALVFHQFFEGIALGTRINDLQCKSWKKPIFMGILFILMTPIGVAIGIGIRSTLNPPATILAQAILDSLSAGILLYNAYVSLMSIEINHNIGFRKSSMQRKVFCFFCMYVGAAIMSVLGMWA